MHVLSVPQELLPLAEASRDPAAVSMLLWLMGQPAAAVQHLASTTSPMHSHLSPLGHAMPSHTPAHAAAAAQRRLEEAEGFDAAALDWVLLVGLSQLSGKAVPHALAGALRWGAGGAVTHGLCHVMRCDACGAM